MSDQDSETLANYKKGMLDQSFRDSVATISKEGNRNYIQPQKPKGKLYDLRSYFSYFYLILFFTLPFIKIGGEPVFLINILERKFILFGKIFWPQDFFIFAIGLLTFLVFVIVFIVLVSVTLFVTILKLLFEMSNKLFDNSKSFKFS
jgi:polyferredoxin